MIYDLEERTAVFGENIILFCKKINRNDITRSLINQLVRSATSIGANYMEANEACSNRDFLNKIRISLKESNETKHWLRMMAKADESNIVKCRELWQKAHEITLIFAKIAKNKLKN